MRAENRRLAKEIGEHVRESINKNVERGLQTHRSLDKSDARRLARQLAGGPRISRAL
jgi:PAB1-binding protein PBP1